MIKLENYEAVGWEHAIRGARNPLNSWSRSDSLFFDDSEGHLCKVGQGRGPLDLMEIGPNDHDLMMRLRNAGTDHRKFMRMITVYVDIMAPLYWWKEFDTYKVGTVANSCSTMHKIHAKEFTLMDFSDDKLYTYASQVVLMETIATLNELRDVYLRGGSMDKDRHLYSVDCMDILGIPADELTPIEPKDKDIWYEMIQLLPSSYNQLRTVMLNYEVLANIYKSRKNHRLDEWKELCKWIETLPYSELITGGTDSNGGES